ncbi:M15 family metallopeptidase [Curtobacterium sp. 1P10AnD]|uniref:M15 family metallopeptidase n=1 Tax=Curtobacterium sp. 1P10AnD TaxID=3132283 RepID=UPI0039A02F6F
MTTLINDPRVLAVPVRPTLEPLVRLADLGVRTSSTGAGGLVRRSVAQRLARADRALPAGVHLLVVEGYRTLAAQCAIIADYRATLAALHPQASSAELDDLVSRFVAPAQAAPHVAGAAVDCTLVGDDGEQLWMGTAIDDTPEQSGGRCFTASPDIDDEARANRALLADVLEPVGMVNYETEWWHWSHGDRYWAHRTGAAAARYEAVPEAPGAAVRDSGAGDPRVVA